MASGMLPWWTHLSPFIKSNIHLHAKAIAKNQGRNVGRGKAFLSLKSLSQIFYYIREFLEGLQIQQTDSEWGEYYNFTNYSVTSFEKKEQMVLRLD